MSLAEARELDRHHRDFLVTMSTANQFQTTSNSLFGEYSDEDLDDISSEEEDDDQEYYGNEPPPQYNNNDDDGQSSGQFKNPLQDQQLPQLPQFPTVEQQEHHDRVRFNNHLRPFRYNQFGYAYLTQSSMLCRSERKFDEDEQDQELLDWLDENQEERPEQRNFHGLWTNFSEERAATQQHPSPSPPNISRLRQLIRQYANVCVKRINEWRNRTHRDQQDETNLQWLINERNTWWLLDGLLGMEHRRLQDDAFMSNETFCPNTNNPSRLKYGEDFLAVRNLRTKKLVEEEDEATNGSRNCHHQYQYSSTVVKWLHKCKQEDINIRHLRSLTQVKEEDKCGLRNDDGMYPETPGTVLDPDHTPYDANTSVRLKQIWTALRAGRLDVAKEICFQNGEPWRAQSLLGGTVSQLRPDGNGEGKAICCTC